MQRIGGDWLQHIERALDAKTAAAARCPNRPTRRSRTLRSSRSLTAAPSSRLRGTAFRSAAATSWRLQASGDYLELFDALWEAVASIEQDWVLFKPRRLSPHAGLCRRVALRDAKRAGLPCVRRAKPGAWLSRRRVGRLRQGFARNALPAARSRPAAGAPVVAHAAALAAGGLLELLDLDSAGAGSQRRRGRCRRHAGRLAGQAPAITNICSEYASWAKHAWRATGRVALSRHPMATPEHRRTCVCCGAIARASGGGIRLDGERSYGCRQCEGDHEHRCRRPAGAGAAFGLQLFILAADIAASHRG